MPVTTAVFKPNTQSRGFFLNATSTRTPIEEWRTHIASRQLALARALSMCGTQPPARSGNQRRHPDHDECDEARAVGSMNNPELYRTGNEREHT